MNMDKIRKIKGGMSMFVTEDETLLVNSNCRNTVYVYDLESRSTKPVFWTRTVSNVAEKAISPNKKLLAAKNTSGMMALVSLETGEELFRNPMGKSEGYSIAFTDDGKHVLDMDWSGRTMLLNCQTNQCDTLDGPVVRGMNGYPHVTFMSYDRYSKQLYRIVEDLGYNQRGIAQTSRLCDDKVSYSTVSVFKKRAPGLLDCISLCKLRNYYKDGGSIVVTDKDFNELERSPLPARFDGCNTNLVKMWISPGEKYGFFACQGMSILFDLAKRRTVREFDYDFIDEFTMVNDDTTFIISTWDGSYIGNI